VFKFLIVVLGGLVVGVLAILPKVRGFKPGRGLWIFEGDKNSQSLQPHVERFFTAC
jgi:hypothetical protein